MDTSDKVLIGGLVGAVIGGVFVGLFASENVSRLENLIALRDREILKLENKILCKEQKDMEYGLCKALMDKE